MKRSSFLKSVAMLFAAPKIITELPRTVSVAADVALEGSQHTVLHYYFKLTEEQIIAWDYFNYLFTDKTSFVWRNCEMIGIDLSKDYHFMFMAKDDFSHNIRTCQISQIKRI